MLTPSNRTPVRIRRLTCPDLLTSLEKCTANDGRTSPVDCEDWQEPLPAASIPLAVATLIPAQPQLSLVASQAGSCCCSAAQVKSSGSGLLPPPIPKISA
jgi:hypothetical protein